MRKIIPIFVPHQGCVHRCSFCHQPYITGVSLHTTVTPDDIRARIDTALQEPKSRAKGAKFEVAFYGGSFTGLDIAVQKQFLHIAQQYVEQGKLTGIRLSTHPNMFDDQVFGLLSSFSVTTIELGVQSFNDDVLKQAQRGHTVDDVEQTIRRLQKLSIEVGIHLMIGLPGDSLESSLYSTDRAIALQPASVRIHPTLVIQHTRLAKLYHSGHYTPLSLEDAVETCKQMVKRFQAHHISVIRIGLQPTESMEQNIVAGPYHPAFRQLVDSALMYDQLESLCARRGVSDGDLTIIAAFQDISTVRGQQNRNIKRLQERFHYRTIHVKAGSNLHRGEIRIE
jgi:histone acetyltransferase (RNA polymerase elongator complex component)